MAAYQYDAFGNVSDHVGIESEQNEWRFSTKPSEEENGWLYYGFRYYDPQTGRWPSRDPFEESGGVNLYGFLGNNPAGKWDYLGMLTVNYNLISKGNCGEHYVEIEFSWSAIPERTYTVQEVKITGKVEPCNSVEKITEFDEDYWEYWPRLGHFGSVIDGSGSAAFGCSKGKIEFEGNIRVYKRCDIAYLNDNGDLACGPRRNDSSWSKGGHPSAGRLMSTTSEPWFWGDASKAFDSGSRKVTVEWDCCTEDSPSNVSY